MTHPFASRASTGRKVAKARYADGGGVDDSIDLSSPGEGPYSLGQTMAYERAKRDSEEVSRGERFVDNGSRVPGRQKARNDSYMAKRK